MSHFGHFEHHFQVPVGDHIPHWYLGDVQLGHLPTPAYGTASINPSHSPARLNKYQPFNGWYLFSLAGLCYGFFEAVPYAGVPSKFGTDQTSTLPEALMASDALRSPPRRKISSMVWSEFWSFTALRCIMSLPCRCLRHACKKDVLTAFVEGKILFSSMLSSSKFSFEKSDKIDWKIFWFFQGRHLKKRKYDVCVCRCC